MKKKIIIPALLIIMVAIGLFAYMGNTGSAAIAKDVTVYSPDWVHLECGVVEHGKTEYFQSWPYQVGQFATVDCSEFTKEGCELKYYIDPALEPGFTDICIWVATADKCNEYGCGLATGAMSPTYGNWKYLDDISQNEYYKFYVYDREGFLCKTQKPLTGFQVRKTFDEYGLIISGDTPLIKKTGTCSLGSSDMSKVEQGAYPSGGELRFSGGEGISYVNYINEWNPMYRGDLHQHVLYGDVYCTGQNTVFKVEEVTMANGNKAFFAAGSAIHDADIECCPQMQGCNNNFKFDNVVGDCPKGLDSECPGYGYWYSYGPRKAQAYTCVDTVCVQETKNVGCSTPADCPGGYCDMSSPVASDWECKSGTPPPSFCGDSICDELTENFENCPTDCMPSNKDEDDSMLTIILIVLGVLAVILLVVLLMKKRSAGTF